MVKDMRKFRARLVHYSDGKIPQKIDVDNFLIIKRAKGGVTVIDESDEHYLGVFDFTITGGNGHARIFWSDGKLYIEDMGSKNGTFITRGGVEKLVAPDDNYPAPRRLIKKSCGLRVGLTNFSLEVEPIQTIIDHHGPGTINVTDVRGDYQSIEINDSVIQRSNIGSTVKEGMDEKQFKKTVEWLDGRNQARTESLRQGQLELKGMTENIYRRIEIGFNKMLKEFPTPTSIEKEKLTIVLSYSCSCCNEHIGVIKDKRWKRWLMLGVAGALLGVGAATFGMSQVGKVAVGDGGFKGMKRIFQEFSGKPLDEIPAEKFLLTTEEKDKILDELRSHGIMEKFHFCPSCNKWVCVDCFDAQELMCISDVQKNAW